MLKRAVKWALLSLGYEVRKASGPRSFVLHTYRKADGTFDYDAYRQIQQDGNKRKLDQVWAIEENIAFVSEYVRRVVGVPEFGICHGTRRGREQAWFREFLGCQMIGTEISDTAQEFPNTIQWDFHDVKPGWIDSADFIYSNSLDHSYDPEKCLGAWMSCLSKRGVCILEHSAAHGPRGASALDPFGADIVEMPYLITRWGAGAYHVRDILDAPATHAAAGPLHFIAVQRT